MPNKIQREDTTSGAAYLCKELPHKRVRRKKKLIGKNNFSQGKGKFPYF